MKGQRYFAARQDEKKGADLKGKIKPEYRDLLIHFFMGQMLESNHYLDFF